ncbi:hypothetical protein QYH69_15940 [Paraburkholderia sp. SARCC-3016]|uniref:hypothetical protein n=1 Tax=Paraburkholderia sp. SARCC-3016 TaxID=3058611 RepID=UPI0028097C02|nr:hypothetical protein [Paraburkholderia sp. SARCC-3016]MDQ7978739.1 hypothetical protein [Paraburkholderia sp. SARCC-3016]
MPISLQNGRFWRVGSGKRIGILNAQVHAISMRIEFSCAAEKLPERHLAYRKTAPKNYARKLRENRRRRKCRGLYASRVRDEYRWIPVLG